jgi:hypothetical protein
MDLVGNFAATAKAISSEIAKTVKPPEEGFRSPSEKVVLNSLVRGTRGYIEKVANQANGCYANGWYDACAVMIRRLIETLIIESFEKHQISNKIKNSSGDFLYLRDLITLTLNETSWNLSRNCKSALPKLKDIGDKSAHSRRFIAQRGDIDKILDELRVVVQEMVFLAGLK